MALGVSVGPAKIRLHRARTRLRASLEGRSRISRTEGNDFRCDRLPPVVLQRPRSH